MPIAKLYVKAPELAYLIDGLRKSMAWSRTRRRPSTSIYAVWPHPLPARIEILLGSIGVGPNQRSGYTSRTNLKVKVLDFVQLGGPKLTVGRTIFELWLVL